MDTSPSGPLNPVVEKMRELAGTGCLIDEVPLPFPIDGNVRQFVLFEKGHARAAVSVKVDTDQFLRMLKEIHVELRKDKS